MKALDRRLNKLEERFKVSNENRCLIILFQSFKRLSPDSDRCVQILKESGFIKLSGFTMVHLDRIPADLNASEVERFLREEGATITGFSKR